MRQEGEPSVEEILDSIKKVIARDNRETLQGERRRRASVGMDEAAYEPAEQAGRADTDHVLDLGEAGSELAPELPGELSAELPAETGSGAPFADVEALDAPLVLTTESAARSMRESLATLALVAEPAPAQQGARTGETSLEGLTRELLRPMLAQWLDRNLPPIVERLVKAEIARIAGPRG